MHIHSLGEAVPVLRDLWRSGRSIGSVHTLGALHEGHAIVIRTARAENDYVVVTVYPNKAQFAPGTRYQYDLERDVRFALAAGATHVISSHDAEMYPDGYSTFLDQGPQTQRLDGTVVPFLFRGMITMCVRWISFVRPHRTYWGLKDIGQTLLVRRAIRDLLIDTEIREIPCVRYRSGIPVSSRLMRLPVDQLREVASIRRALEMGRRFVAAGESRAAEVLRAIEGTLDLRTFRLCYAKLALASDFTEPAIVPHEAFILHVVVTNGVINHFDGHLLQSREDILDGPATVWVESEWPEPARA